MLKEGVFAVSASREPKMDRLRPAMLIVALVVDVGRRLPRSGTSGDTSKTGLRRCRKAVVTRNNWQSVETLTNSVDEIYNVLNYQLITISVRTWGKAKNPSGKNCYLSTLTKLSVLFRFTLYVLARSI